MIQIKEFIISLSKLLQHFNISASPETFRLSKFNDASVLPNIQKTNTDIIDFLACSSSCNGFVPTEVSPPNLQHIGLLVGFPYAQALQRNSYHNLLFLDFICRKFKAFVTFERIIMADVTRTLGMEIDNTSSKGNKVSSGSHHDIYEQLQSIRYEIRRLSRLLRSVNFRLVEMLPRQEPEMETLVSPCMLRSTMLYVAASNGHDISKATEKLKKLISVLALLIDVYRKYEMFVKWMNSVDYHETAYVDNQLLYVCDILKLRAQVNMQLNLSAPIPILPSKRTKTLSVVCHPKVSRLRQEISYLESELQQRREELLETTKKNFKS